MRQEGLLIEESHPVFGDYWRPPVRVGFEHLSSRLAPAAAAGEHTRAILAELGHAPETISRWLEMGVVDVWEPTPVPAEA